MKRVGLAIASLLAGVVLLAAAFIQGAIPGTNGCVLRSVDERDYVAQNEAVFSTISFPNEFRKATTKTYSIGVPARHACLPSENGPPFEAFVTWHVFLPKKGERPPGFDRRILGPGWASQNGGPAQETFRRGAASLSVGFSDEATTFAVDYRAYDR